MTAALRAHSGPAESVLALFAGPDIGVFCRSYLAHLAWHREDGNHADGHAAEAIAAARRMRHPFSQAIALDYAAMLYVFRGESRAALERGREAVELCSRHGFAYYLAMANVLTGWAGAAEGDVAAGLAQLREGLDGMRRLGAEIRLPYYFALLAETFGRAGQVGEALASLSTGLCIREQERRGMGGRGVASRAGGSAGRRRKARSGARQLPAGPRGSAAVGFAGVRAKIVDSRGRNGRNHLHRTLLERRAGQTEHIRRGKRRRQGEPQCRCRKLLPNFAASSAAQCSSPETRAYEEAQESL